MNNKQHNQREYVMLKIQTLWAYGTWRARSSDEIIQPSRRHFVLFP